MKIKVIRQAETSFRRDLTNKALRSELKSKYGISGRRLDNFTLSAMLLLAELKDDLSGFDDTSLFSVANYFSVELLQRVVEQLGREDEIKPLDFVATVGNAANYYLAREFGFNGANIFTASEKTPLSKILTMAALELTGKRSQAVVVVRWEEAEVIRRCQVLLCTAENDVVENALSVTQIEQSDLLAMKCPYSLVL